MESNVERVLEDGIASYGKQEALAGLPDRILGRVALVQAEAPVRRVRRVVWGIGIAAVGLAAFLLWPHPRGVMKAQMMAAAAKPMETRAAVSGIRAVGSQRVRAVKRRPRLAVFPTPTPLTVEERRLVAWVEAYPEGAAQAVERWRKQSEPLRIEELRIEPLDFSERQ